jgi:hypothetical protein
MGNKKRLRAKMLGIPVLAIAGFLFAATVAGVGLAIDTTSTTSTTTSTSTSTSTTTTTTTTTTVANEGCTPGYWKVDQHFDSWPVPLSTTLSGAGFVGTGNQSATLLAALSFQGGPTVQDAKNILMRAAAAAYLNSFAVNYPLSTAALVAEVNAALATGDRTTILNEASKLDGYNNLGCPLN